MKRNVYTDGNGSSLIQVEGMGVYVPAADLEAAEEKIAQLQNDILAKRVAELTKERDALMAQLASKTDIANQLKDGLAESFEKQMELKAQVERLRNGVFHFNRTHGDLNPLLKAVADTPAQCLVEVKAQAVEDAANELASLISAPPGAFSAALIKLNLIANQLRQSAKAGS